MVRDAARRLLTITGLVDAKPGRPAGAAPADPADGQSEDKSRAVLNDVQQPAREREQDVMAMGEPQTDFQHDYFDFAPEPPPETEGIERPEGEDDPVLYEPVLEALKTVQDPEIPVNLVDLGLIYELSVKEGGVVYVEMTLTTPACPVAQSMPGEVENAVASVPGVSDVRVKLVWTPPWDRDRMSEEAKLELGLL